jgi:hypothetical protein
MNGSNEDTNIGSSRRESAEAAVRVPKARKGQQTFDERFKDLMAFKAEFGHCNVSLSKSSDKKHSSLGRWCHGVRKACEIMKVEGGISKDYNYKLSKGEMKRLENAGFELGLSRKKITFDEHFKDRMAFKAEFGHCQVPATRSRNNKYLSLGFWCSDIRRTYKTIKQGGTPRCKLSRADIQRLEKAGFHWH